MSDPDPSSPFEKGRIRIRIWKKVGYGPVSAFAVASGSEFFISRMTNPDQHPCFSFDSVQSINAG